MMLRRQARHLLCVVGSTIIALVCWTDPLEAQQKKPQPTRPSARKTPRTRAIEVSGSVGFLNGYGLGESVAMLTPNLNRPPFTLLRSTTDVESAPSFEARLGYPLTRLLSVEGGLTFSRPEVRVAVSGDPEIPSGANFVGDRLTQYVIDASGVANLHRLAFFKNRIVPFVMGGGGYLRQLHDERVLVETGQIYHVGGGVKYFPPGKPGALRRLGFRGDVRYYQRKGGFDIEENQWRRFAVVSGGVAYRF